MYSGQPKASLHTRTGKLLLLSSSDLYGLFEQRSFSVSLPAADGATEQVSEHASESESERERTRALVPQEPEHGEHR